ncbi:MAG: penicillin-binding protein 2 [Candidatus Lloydbacteria bacterium]|nr:penicillin-binding protein 2 [Candidatus Lloydbacteria bacterium]
MYTSRIRALSIFIFLFASVLAGRLFFVQVIYGKEYSDSADRQYVTPTSNIFSRGSIYFQEKNGNPVSAATLKTGFTIAINPKVLTDAEKTFKALNAVTPIDRDSFFLHAGKKDDPYEVILSRVPQDVGERIAALDLTGVILDRERWRFYPAEKLASQVLGFVGYTNDTLSGRYGLERFYNDVLKRENKDLFVNFFAEVFANIAQTIFHGDEEREGDITLTIEPHVESFLEQELSRVSETWKSDAVGGVIINPKTGAIYAMGALPSFNPNTFNSEKNQAVFPNPTVESVFEMGSIIKPLTMAAGLDSGAVTPETEYYDAGFVELDGARIKNFDEKGRGRVPMQEILNQSLNTGSVFVMQKMGKEKFRDYFKAYELGEETGIDLPNEAAGIITNLDSPRTLEYATAAFGQGIAMTPIETARALASLGNGGVLVTPHVVDSIIYRTGFSKKIVYNPGKQVLKKDTSETITRMLVRVVDEALVGGTVKLPRYSIAAKTGTAQIAKENGRGYYEDRYLHSFFGYFPAYDPQFLVFLYTVNPKGVKYASQTLTNPFMNIAKFLLNYYEAPPDR